MMTLIFWIIKIINVIIKKDVSMDVFLYDNEKRIIMDLVNINLSNLIKSNNNSKKIKLNSMNKIMIK